MTFRFLFFVRGALTLLLFATSAVAQDEAAPVAVSPVVEREVAVGERAVGTVLPARESTVGSAVDGRVIELLVEEGDPVTKDQPVAKLRTETLEIELSAAQAELRLRQQELAELENGSLPEEIEQSEARKAAAQGAMQYAKANYRRMEKLYAQGTVNEEQLEQAKAASIQAAESYREASASHELVKKGPRQERIQQARARVQLQQQSVKLIEDRIGKHTLMAPFDGYVSAQHTEVGAWLSQGDPVVEIIELGTVEVEAHVVGETAAALSKGASVRIEAAALPDEVFTGTVAQIVPKADMRTRTFPVKVRVGNEIEDGVPLLKSGMLARLTLPTGSRDRAPLVPKDALVLGGPEPAVFVVETSAARKENGKASQGVVRSVPVRLGVAEGTWIQVEAPLKEGSLVVVRGNERLQPGQPVSIISIQRQTDAALTGAQ